MNIRVQTHGPTAAATADKGGLGWAWLERLAMMFPNSPATYPRRSVWSEKEITDRLTALFGSDRDGPHPIRPCWVCKTPTQVRWGRSLWPPTDSGAYLNNQPAGRKDIVAFHRDEDEAVTIADQLHCRTQKATKPSPNPPRGTYPANSHHRRADASHAAIRCLTPSTIDTALGVDPLVN